MMYSKDQMQHKGQITGWVKIKSYPSTLNLNYQDSLKSMYINDNIYKLYCREMHYHVKVEIEKKTYER